MAQTFEPGDLVFAKVKGYPFWPARVENSTQQSSAKFPVFFFGTYEYASVGKKDILPYEVNKDTLGKKRKNRRFNSGLEEIVKNPTLIVPKYDHKDKILEVKLEKVKFTEKKNIVTPKEEPQSENEDTMESEDEDEDMSESESEEEIIPEPQPKKQARRELSELEKMRNNNIADNKLMLSKLLAELKEMSPKPISKPKQPVRSRLSEPIIRRCNPSRSGRFNPLSYRPPITRRQSRRGSFSSYGDSESGNSSPGKEENHLLVRLKGFPKSPYIDDSDEEDEDRKGRKRRASTGRRACTAHEIRAPEDIGDDEIAMVAENVKEKRYDTEFGSTCHQCRQKTIDMKTICRSADCRGIQGMFCGPCLRNRYGENVKVALKDANWICPPCRGICNCSICRTRKGRMSTGILIHLARESGFDNAKDYLFSLKHSSKTDTNEETVYES